MKAKERLDKIMDGCCSRIQEEVSALLGKPFKLGTPQAKVVSKEDFFAECGGKSVLAHVKMEGDLEGRGCLLVAVKDAIRIGGTLIMLPESELENVVNEGAYTEEIEDSYGEIANIICGSVTSTFEEQYPKAFRVIRTEQEIVVPAKLDMASGQPIAATAYYTMAVAMRLGDKELGLLNLLLPAAVFGLVEEAEAKPQATASGGDGKPEERQPAVAAEAPATGTSPEDAQEGGIAGNAAGTVTPPVGGQAVAPAIAAKTRRDSGKQQKAVDDLLKNGLARVGEETGALLGGSIKVLPDGNQLLTKGGLLEQAGGKQALARLEIRGERQGEAYLFMDLRGAIRLGGSLIMLPESELEETVRNEDFGEDASDAYGEITNIIAGVFTAVFEEQYRHKLGFVKTSLETLVTAKIDPDSDEVLANQLYYLSGGRLQFNDRDLGRLLLAVPATVLELEELLLAEADAPAELGQFADTRGSAEMAVQPRADTRREEPAEAADILLFTDDEDEAASIAATLRQSGYSSRILHYKDQLHAFLTPAVQLVFLVMKEVNEQGFGVAIKLSSAGLAVPLIAGGPAWTRTLVLKAVKYGAVDILITPAAPEEIREKVEMNLARIAA